MLLDVYAPFSIRQVIRTTLYIHCYGNTHKISQYSILIITIWQPHCSAKLTLRTMLTTVLKAVSVTLLKWQNLALTILHFT